MYGFLSIFQGFLPVTLSLVVMFFIKSTFDKKNQTSKDFFKEGFYYASAFIIAVVLYLITVKISVYITGIGLSSYRGINNMGQMGITLYLKSILKAYKGFFSPEVFYFGTKKLYKVILMLVFMLFFYKLKDLYRIDKNKFYQVLFLNVVLPVAINFLYVMTVEDGIYTIMALPQLMIFPYLLFLLEDEKILNFSKSKNFGYVIMFLIIFISIRWANVLYLKAQFVQQRMFSYYTSLITQIKSMKGYKEEYPVVFVNEYKNKDKNIKDLPFPKVFVAPYISAKDLINNYAYVYFLDRWLAYSPEYEKKEKFEKLPEVKAMPHYPDYGSIKIMNKTIVVKF